jgi:hypothetical protein
LCCCGGRLFDGGLICKLHCLAGGAWGGILL